MSSVGEKANYAVWLGKKTRADSKAQILVTAVNEWRDGRDDWAPFIGHRTCMAFHGIRSAQVREVT